MSTTNLPRFFRGCLSAPLARSAQRHLRALGWLLLCCALGGLSQRSWGEDAARLQTPDFSDPKSSEPNYSELETQLEQHITFLASDRLRGRDVGTEGLELAAQHIAAAFADAGLETELFDGTPFQTFMIPLGVTVGDAAENRLEITWETTGGEDRTTLPRLGEAYRPLGAGGSAAASGPLTFVGYGITAPQRSYDDYAGLDVRGHVVMMLRKEPSGSEADKRFDGAATTRHAYFETKIKNAAAQGAVAVLLVNDDDSIAQQVATLDRQRAAETRRMERLEQQIAELPAEANQLAGDLAERQQELAAMLQDLERQRALAAEGLMAVEEAGVKPIVEGMPVLSIARSLASELLQTAAGKTLPEVKQLIDNQVRPHSMRLSAEVNLQSSLTPSEAASSNVLGVLPGRGDLAEETVIIGAHYDHVGMGGPGSLAPGTIAIHNGADDNASGTSVLIASAHLVAGRLADQPHHRRVLFIAFTGEERGLLGSEHYVRNPRFALEQTVAMINLDMVGRLRNNDLTVYGTGTSPGFEALVARANERTGFSLFNVASGYGPSDHQSFYTRKIPVLFFFTGLHRDYHRPSDTIEKINLNGMARITDITSIVAAELASSEQRPQHVDTTREVKIRQQTQAYLGVTLQDVSRSSRPAEDPAAAERSPTGAIVSSVAAGSPAQQAGIQAGDRLLRVGGVAVRSLEDVIATVAEREAGDVVEIHLDRRGTAMSVQATLRIRPGQ